MSDTNLVKQLSSVITELEALNKAKTGGITEGEAKSIEEKVFANEKFQSVLTQIEQAQKSALTAEKNAKEAGEKIQELETKAARPSYVTGETQETREFSEIKSLVHKMYKTAGSMGNVENARTALLTSPETTELQKKYLATFNNPDGGFLIPQEYDRTILKKITEISNIRAVARVITQGGGILNIPTREKLLRATWVGEAQSYQESESVYGRREMKPHKLTALALVTREQLEDAFVDVAAQVDSDIVEQFARSEGEAFVKGGLPGTPQAANQPQGFLNALYTNQINSGVVNSFSSDDLITMTGTLKVGYEGVFGFNRRTMAYILSMKDGVGGYLWHPGADRGISDKQPLTLVGHKFIILPDMPDFDAVGATPVVFADFYRAYTISDRLGMSMLVDPYTKSSVGMVQYTAYRRVDGQVVMPEAISILNNS